MTDHRSTYAARFNKLAILRPQPPLTDEQFEAWVVTLPPFAQYQHRFVRALGSSHWAAARARTES